MFDIIWNGIIYTMPLELAQSLANYFKIINPYNLIIPSDMKLFTLFITFFLTTQVIAQPVQKIKQLLKDKKFVPLNSYIDKPQKSNVTFGWETLRTIVGDYQEGTIKIEENVPANDGTGRSFFNTYQVYLLADKNKIFYYRFVNKNDEIVDSLKDSTEYVAFENTFRQTYGVPLNHYDLFLTIVYGSHCGYVGKNPPFMDQLNILLQEKDVNAIRHWLKSANAEKQLYALNGYRILVNQGYSLTDEEKRIISIVEQKKGTVSTCSGCLSMNETFQQVVSNINSIPAEFLKPEKPNPLDVIFKKNNVKVEKKASYWWGSIFGIIAVLAIIYLIRRTKKGSV